MSECGWACGCEAVRAANETAARWRARAESARSDLAVALAEVKALREQVGYAELAADREYQHENRAIAESRRRVRRSDEDG